MPIPSLKTYSNILLIGFMGSGKSYVGRVLSKIAKMKFLDLDNEILKKSPIKSIQEIFDAQGEKYFRSLEKQTLLEILQNDRQIISLGGGTLFYIEKEDLELNDKLIIFLDSSYEECRKRVKRLDNRPLFKDEKMAKKLFDERYPKYTELADISIETKDLSGEEIALKISKIIC